MLALALLLGLGVLSQQHTPAQAGSSVTAPVAAAGDRFVADGDLILKPGDTVEHDAIALAGKIVVPDGAHVKHDVNAVDGSIEIGGTVDHDVIAANGDITLLATAKIGNDVTALNGHVNQARDARVGGHSTGAASQQSNRDHESGLLGSILGLLIDVVLAVVFIAVGTLVVLVWPRQANRAVTSLEHAAWASTAVGILTGILIIPVTILLSGILAITIVGILLIPFLWLGLLALWFAGLITVGLWAGRRLADSGRLPVARGSLLVTAAVGMGIIAGLPLLLGAVIPWLAWPLVYFLGFVGLGAMVLNRFSNGISLPHLGAHAAPNHTRPLQRPPSDRRAS